MSKYIWLLDAGHGGIGLWGYQTFGYKSPIWGDNSQLFEGEFNRAILNRVKERMDLAGIANFIVSSRTSDNTIEDRIARINLVTKAVTSESILLSFHVNNGDGNGFEVCTTPGVTGGMEYLNIFVNAIRKEFSITKIKKDIPPEDEDEVKLLKKSNCPIVLLKSFFLCNEVECKRYLLSLEGRDRIANAYFDAVLTIEGV